MAWGNYFYNWISARIEDSEEGQGMVEYGLIIALVAVIAAAGFLIFGNFLNGFIGGLSDRFEQ
jgi:Flp pilus assembly pilin Flp